MGNVLSEEELLYMLQPVNKSDCMCQLVAMTMPMLMHDTMSHACMCICASCQSTGLTCSEGVVKTKGVAYCQDLLPNAHFPRLSYLHGL